MVKTPVALFKVHGDAPDLPQFETAGPNGGTLVRESRPIEGAAEEAGANDALGQIPEPEVHSQPVPDPRAAEHSHSHGGLFEQTVPTRSVLVEETTGEEVTQVRRGLRIDGRFVDLTENLEAIEEATKLEEMEVVSTRGSSIVPRIRVKGAYYVGTDGGGAKALRLLHDSLKVRNRVAVVKWTKRSRQTLGVLAPYRGVLVAIEVAWANEIREIPERATAIAAAETSEAEREAALDLVDALADDQTTLDDLSDDALALRAELIVAARNGAPLPKTEKPAVDEVDLALEELLRRSSESVAA
jgi:non-homologous end joining protein Ku